MIWGLVSAGGRPEPARIDLDRALETVRAPELAIERAHQLAHLPARKESGRAAAQMQLAEAAILAEQRHGERQFLRQVLDILGRSVMVARAPLVARAVVADGVAERHVHVDRQRLADAADVALGKPLPQLRLAERLDEAVRGRVRGG